MITLIKNKLFSAPKPVQNKLPENKVIPHRFGIKITDRATITAAKVMGAIAGLATLGMGAFYGYTYLNSKKKLSFRANFLTPTPFDKQRLEPINIPSDVDGSGEIPTQAFDENVLSEEILSTKSMLGIAALIMISVCTYLYSRKGLFQPKVCKVPPPLPQGLLDCLLKDDPVEPPGNGPSSPPPQKDAKSPTNSIKSNISGEGGDQIAKSPLRPPSPPTRTLPYVPKQVPEILSIGPPEDLPPSLPKIVDLEYVYTEFHDTEVKFNEHISIRSKMCVFFTDERIHSLANVVSNEVERRECCKHLKNLFNSEHWLLIIQFSNDLLSVFKDFANHHLPERQSKANDYAESLIDALTKISNVSHAFSEINVAMARSIHFVDTFKAVKHPWKTAMAAFKKNNNHPAYSKLHSISDAFIETTQRLMRYKLFVEKILAIVENETLLEPGTKDRLQKLNNQLHEVVASVNENQKKQDELFESWKKSTSEQIKRDTDSKTMREADTLAQAIVKAKKKDRCLVMNSGVIQCSPRVGLTTKKTPFKSSEIEIKVKANTLLTDAISIAQKRFEEKEEGIESKIKLLRDALHLLNLIKGKKEEKKKENPQGGATLVIK